MRCVICKKEYLPWENCIFHKYPAKKEFRERWDQIIGIKAPVGARVCAAHFAEDCYTKVKDPLKRIKMKKGAIPTLNMELKPVPPKSSKKDKEKKDEEAPKIESVDLFGNKYRSYKNPQYTISRLSQQYAKLQDQEFEQQVQQILSFAKKSQIKIKGCDNTPSQLNSQLLDKKLENLESILYSVGGKKKSTTEQPRFKIIAPKKPKTNNTVTSVACTCAHIGTPSKAGTSSNMGVSSKPGISNSKMGISSSKMGISSSKMGISSNMGIFSCDMPKTNSVTYIKNAIYKRQKSTPQNVVLINKKPPKIPKTVENTAVIPTPNIIGYVKCNTTAPIPNNLVFVVPDSTTPPTINNLKIAALSETPKEEYILPTKKLDILKKPSEKSTKLVEKPTNAEYENLVEKTTNVAYQKLVENTIKTDNTQEVTEAVHILSQQVIDNPENDYILPHNVEEDEIPEVLDDIEEVTIKQEVILNIKDEPLEENSLETSEETQLEENNKLNKSIKQEMEDFVENLAYGITDNNIKQPFVNMEHCYALNTPANYEEPPQKKSKSDQATIEIPSLNTENCEPPRKKAKGLLIESCNERFHFMDGTTSDFIGREDFISDKAFKKFLKYIEYKEREKQTEK